VDLLDETPIFDIKPYVPFVDCIPDAKGGWTDTEIPKYSVTFSSRALSQLGMLVNDINDGTDLKVLLMQMLGLDPRPTPQKKSYPFDDPKSEGMSFAFRIHELDVKWEIRQKAIFVTEIVDLQGAS
jgi:hypothetical protein